jgi:CheY-like chemotaxis protein
VTESIKLEVLDGSIGAPATFGSTTGMSRGELEAVVQGAVVPLRSRCVVRFLATTRIKPVAVPGEVVDVDDSGPSRVVRVEFDTPLEQLDVAPKTHETEARDTTVLLVDDNFHVRDILERYLTQEGYDVRLVNDGEAGLKALRDELPDVLILDINMPRMGGLDVLERMQEEGLKPSVILTISGEADHDSARKSLELGAHDFLVKPLELAYLDWAIRLRL